MAKIDVTGNYFAIKAAAVAAGIIKEGELPKKADLLKMVAEYNAKLLEQPEQPGEIKKIWRATDKKSARTKVQKLLISLLSSGATKQEICEQFGWKDWVPSKSCVRKLGYSIYQQEDGVFFVAQ